jgi:nucleoid-associated protein EbfC
MGSGFAKKKKQAKAMQEQIMQMQSQMQSSEAIGTAGNGLVTLTLTGGHELKSLVIKPECVDPEDVEGLQDLIKAAYADALSKLDSQMTMPKMAGGIGGGLPDFSMFGL